MGRPVEVCAEDVIAAGVRLENRGVEVKSTRLRTELGERGRPSRLLAVWAEHVASRAPAVDAPAAATQMLPDRVRRLADGVSRHLAAELERIFKTVFDEGQATAASRFKDESADWKADRAADRAEIDGAFNVIDRLGEQQDALRATLHQAKQKSASKRRECRLKDGLLSTAASERTDLESRVAKLQATIKRERSENADLRMVLMRAETRAESGTANMALLRQALRASKGLEAPRSDRLIRVRPVRPLRPLSKHARSYAQGSDNADLSPKYSEETAPESRLECPL